MTPPAVTPPAIATPELSVVIPTHQPDAARIAQTLAGLRAQSLAPSRWETILVDNASQPPLALAPLAPLAPPNVRLVAEPALGLTAARLCGLRAAAGALVVLVDDDNVLAPDYLERCLQLFPREPRLGAVGGKSLGAFAHEPAPWQREFLDLLAVRDLGEAELRVATLRPPGASRNEYPACAPIGAGMALRREAALAWCETAAQHAARRALDRAGRALTSGGDNDIVLSVLRAGWTVGYSPTLRLTHLIPAGRLQPDYLARLNRAIQRSWMRVLALHDANPWPPIPAWTVPLRQAKAWFTFQAWRSTAHYIRWQGVCGHFEGRRR